MENQDLDPQQVQVQVGESDQHWSLAQMDSHQQAQPGAMAQDPLQAVLV
jgi:hypothetical protein